MIDTGDYVHHAPTGERWVVAAVDGEKLYWCGYPFGGYADLADCTLTKKATDKRRDELLIELSKYSEIPGLLAKRMIEKTLVSILKAIATGSGENQELLEATK